MMYKHFFKRVGDFLISFFAMILLSPLLLLVSILVRIKLGKPIIFKQRRPGYKAKIFTIYKFRTMTDTTDSSGKLLPDAERLTKFGRFLRSTSLDELPELFNILRGDMAIVGPRPLLIDYLPLYNDFQKLRHDVRPGLTGLAQVNGRNSISWAEKFQFDVDYVNKCSVFLDCSIILKTIKKVFIREGISSAFSETMESFKGNK